MASVLFILNFAGSSASLLSSLDVSVLFPEILYSGGTSSQPSAPVVVTCFDGDFNSTPFIHGGSLTAVIASGDTRVSKPSSNSASDPYVVKDLCSNPRVSDAKASLSSPATGLSQAFVAHQDLSSSVFSDHKKHRWYPSVIIVGSDIPSVG